MVDSDVQGSEAMEANETWIKQKKKRKMCAECGTTKTPLWRNGPAGPKTLCNACGIRCKKKDPSATKENNDSKKKRNKEINLKQRIRNLVCQVMPQRSRVERHWKKLGEVERAAVLLMSFSA